MKTQLLEVLGAKRRAAGASGVVRIAVGLIIFATLGVVAIGLLQTATTTGWSSSVALIAITVTSLLAALAVALSFFHESRL